MVEWVRAEDGKACFEVSASGEGSSSVAQACCFYRGKPKECARVHCLSEVESWGTANMNNIKVRGSCHRADGEERRRTVQTTPLVPLILLSEIKRHDLIPSRLLWAVRTFDFPTTQKTTKKHDRQRLWKHKSLHYSLRI